jgi:hypothetical protein
MPKRVKKPITWKIVPRLPDLDHAKSPVLSSLSFPRSRRNYKFAMEQFITWYCSELALINEMKPAARATTAAPMAFDDDSDEWLFGKSHESAKENPTTP